MPAFDLAAFQKEQAEIGEALEKTRAHGLPVAHALDAAWEKAVSLRDVDAGLEVLRATWDEAQPALAIVQAAHPGALKYFVDIKDRIKKMILAGQFPAPLLPASGQQPGHCPPETR